MNEFIKSRQRGIEYLQSPLLLQEEAFVHGFSTRCGGFSRGPYASLNTGMSTGDDLFKVVENRRKFLSLWGFKLEQAIAGQAVHGLNVTRVNFRDRGKGNAPNTAIPGSDGLVTSHRKIVLISTAADCQIIILIDPKQKAAGIAHAGWRGVLKGMAYQLVGEMCREFSSFPGNLKATIGPSICFKCFKVEQEVAQLFTRKGWRGDRYLVKTACEGKYLINLPKITRRQFLEAGLKEKHVEAPDMCTYENPSLFYSYRRDEGCTGRQTGLVALKDSLDSSSF